DVLVVGSELPGTVVELAANINDVVAEGAVLLKLDDRKARLEVEKAQDAGDAAKAGTAPAEAAPEAAQRDPKYQQDTAKAGGVRAERERAQAQVRAAKAGVQVARSKLRLAQTAQRQAQLGLDLTRVRVPATTDASPGGAPPAGRRYLVTERKVQLG